MTTAIKDAIYMKIDFAGEVAWHELVDAVNSGLYNVLYLKQTKPYYWDKFRVVLEIKKNHE